MSQQTVIKYRFSIRDPFGVEIAGSEPVYNTAEDALSKGREYKEKHNVTEYISFSEPIEVVLKSLYEQVRDMILSTWSKHCIFKDTGTALTASNGHLDIYFNQEQAGISYLRLEAGTRIVFNGYIRNINDFSLILELTSVRKP